MAFIGMKYLRLSVFRLNMMPSSGKLVAPRDLSSKPSVSIDTGSSGGRSNFLMMVGWMSASIFAKSQTVSLRKDLALSRVI